MDESIALVEFSKHGRRNFVETVAYAHIEVGLKIWFPHRFPHQLVGELALWSAVGPYNVLLGDAARPDLRNLTCAAGDVPAVARRMNAILEALAAHPKKRRAAEDRRVDAPAALELADAPFASRAFDVLMALADAHREARDDAILRGLKTARTALAPHLNPLQRRKLDTTHSTMKATRGLTSDGR